MDETTRIAFFVPSLVIGGAERVTVTLANGLANRGYDVDVLVAYREGELLDDLDDAVTLIDLNTSIPGLGVLASVPRLRSYLRAVEPPVLFGVMTHANVAAALAALGAGSKSRSRTKLVPIEHNTFGRESGLKSAVTDGLARYLYPSAERVIAVSEGVADSVVQETRISREDVTVLHNPVPIAEVRSGAAEPIEESWLTSPEFETIVSVGRLEPPKDHATVLDAFETVYERRPNARLLLVGRGSQYETIERRIQELGLTDVVSLPGYVENAYAYMGNASVFVLSSKYEGLPTVLVEALACGTPIVATDCPHGPREILADGEFGTLVPVGDAAALSEGLIEQFDDPDDGDRLRSRAEGFSVSTIIERYAAFTERLIEAERA